jgi:adenosylcobinamide-phosphate synthase
LLAVAGLAALLAGLLLQALLGHRLLAALALAPCLPLRSLWTRTRAIRRALAAGDLAAARMALAGTLFRHHAIMDAPSVARAGIELLTVQFAEHVVAPLLWYLLLGFPGALLSKTLMLLRETSSGEFGMPAAAAQRVFHYLPSRLAAMLWLAAGLFVPGADARRCWQALSPHFASAPPQSLALLSAAAALNLSLGGPGSPYGADGWIGHGTARAGAGDLRRAEVLLGLLCLLLFVGLGLVV